MTFDQLCNTLLSAKIEDASYEASLLLEHFCGVDRATQRLQKEHDYAEPALLQAVAARVRRVPLQYLLGEWSFYRQNYEVTPDCLIPRSDTEILVEEAIRTLPQNARFADLCTGSGCIAISTLAERPDTRAVAVEKFSRTLDLARRNAERNGVLDRFCAVCGDVTVAPPSLEFAPFDAILSNPPYIVSALLPSLSPEVQAEPQAALDGGEDGLLFYRAILQNFAHLLKPDGFFLFEIGYDQAQAVTSLGISHGFSHTRVIKDYGKQDRVVFLSRV